MLNKNHILTLVFTSLLFFVATGEVFADVSAELEQAKSNIIFLIQRGDFAEARTKTQKLVADFAGHADLPEKLYKIAGEWAYRLNQEEDAKTIYQQIIQDYPDSTWANKAKLDILKLNVGAIIGEVDLTAAKLAINKFAADNSGHPDLPEALYWIASRECDWRLEMVDEAKTIYQQIIRDYSNSSSASRAKLGVARAGVLSFILLNECSESKEALDKLIADFSGHPDFPETIYWIAEKYRWAREYEQAKELYKRLIQNHPDSFWASRAKIGFSRAEALSFIVPENYKQLEETLDKMAVDFKDHPDLPETFYWIAQECEWMIKLKEANSIYQRVINCCPGNFWADKARLGLSRVNIGDVIEKGDITAAKPAFDKLVVDFNDHPDMAWALYWLAKRYEGQDEFEKAKQLYNQMIGQYPNSEYTDIARKIDIPILDIFSLMKSGERAKALEALDKLVADFKNNPNLPQALLVTGEKYYKEGLSKENKDLADQARDCFEKAVEIWDRLINKLPNSPWLPETCCWAGDAYLKLGKYEKSIQCFQKVADSYHGYNYAWHAQFMVGYCYKELRDAGTIEKSEADAKIKVAYERVLKNYPDCPAANAAHDWLKYNAKSNEGVQK